MKFLNYMDEYDFRARFVPAFIVSLPIVVTFVALFPGAREWRGLAIDPTLEAMLVLLLVRVARDEGKKIEPTIIAHWGGLPTTRFLRHRNSEIESATRERYKKTLSRLVGITFPSVSEETADPVAADSVYGSAVDGLRERRRGKAHGLVFQENCSYGMIRNLLGLRPTGLAIAALCAIAIGGGLYFLPATTSHEWAAVALVICALIGVVLLRWATPAALKRTAEAYAIALLRTCEPIRKNVNTKEA
jgi:hypothetical protein